MGMCKIFYLFYIIIFQKHSHQIIYSNSIFLYKYLFFSFIIIIFLTRENLMRAKGEKKIKIQNYSNYANIR